jgi:hypothetical protein
MSLEKFTVILFITTLYIPPQTVVNSHAVSGIYCTATPITTTATTATTTNSDDNTQPDRHNWENRKSQPQENIKKKGVS